MAKNALADLTSIDLMDLRFAVIAYKRARDVHSTEAFRKESGLTCGRNDLPRFLSGDTDEFRQVKELARFLGKEGFWPVDRSSSITYETISRFIQTEPNEKIEEVLNSIQGCYECFQWSSTIPGMVLVSEMKIEALGGSNVKFALCTEEQVDKEEGRGETYVGCCIYSNRSVIIVMKEKIANRLKLIICDKISPERIIGTVLKSSSRKTLHLTQISLRKTETPVNPRVEYLRLIDETSARHLEEPLTPFDLSLRDKDSRQLRDEIRMVMRKFQIDDNRVSDQSE